MKRILLAATLAALVFSAAAAASTTYVPLHRYSHGPRVCNLQHLLKGRKPSIHPHLKTYHGKVDCHFGPRTVKAVVRMKFLLGFPKHDLHGRRGGIAGVYFHALLVDKKVKRPISWIARAAKRQARLRRLVSSTSACQRRVVGYANSQVGASEVPLGSNWGPKVEMYQSVTGAYHAPWCVSFAQWVLWRAHIGPVANRTAGAVYLRNWAYSKGLLRSHPEPGTIAVWIYSEQHASIVTAVRGSSYTTVDGNWADRVSRVRHDLRYGPPVAFIYLPHCS